MLKLKPVTEYDDRLVRHLEFDCNVPQSQLFRNERVSTADDFLKLHRLMLVSGGSRKRTQGIDDGGRTIHVLKRVLQVRFQNLSIRLAPRT